MTLSRVIAVVDRPAAMCKEHQYLPHIDKMLSRRQTDGLEVFNSQKKSALPAFEETHSRLKKHQDLSNQEGQILNSDSFADLL